MKHISDSHGDFKFHKFWWRVLKKISWNDHNFGCVVWFWFLKLVSSFVTKWIGEYEISFEKWEKNYSRVLERLEEHNLEKNLFRVSKRVGYTIEYRYELTYVVRISNEEKLCRIALFASFGRGNHIGFEESNFENCLEANSFP